MKNTKLSFQYITGVYYIFRTMKKQFRRSMKFPANPMVKLNSVLKIITYLLIYLFVFGNTR